MSCGAEKELRPLFLSYGWVYLHQGGRYEAGTGLYNFRYRDYSPTLGRWMQVDPIGYVSGDFDLYRYVNDDPSFRTDPGGLTDPAYEERILRRAMEQAQKQWEDQKNKLRKESEDLGKAKKPMEINTKNGIPEALESYFDQCAGCSDDAKEAKKAFSNLLRFARETGTRGIPIIEDCCVNWVTDVWGKFLSQSVQTLLAAQKFFKVESVRWKDTILGYEHNALKVTLNCSKPPTVFYLDNSWFGGQGNSFRIFGPGDIPSRYQEIPIGQMNVPPGTLEKLWPWNWDWDFIGNGDNFFGPVI